MSIIHRVRTKISCRRLPSVNSLIKKYRKTEHKRPGFRSVICLIDVIIKNENMNSQNQATPVRPGVHSYSEVGSR